MSHALVCKEAHGDLRRGDTVIDPAEVKRLHAEAPTSFVKRELSHDERLEIAAKAEEAKAAKAKKSPTEKDA